MHFPGSAPDILGKKCLDKTSFRVGMNLKKYRNKAEMKEHNNKTTLHLQKYTACRCRVFFFSSFISCLVSVPFSGIFLLEMKFAETISLLFLMGEGGLKQPSNRRRTSSLRWRRMCVRAGGKHCWRGMRWKRVFELQPHLQPATSDFQIGHMSRWLLVTGTYLTLSYSPMSTLHRDRI